jgi:hypothetical protein
MMEKKYQQIREFQTLVLPGNNQIQLQHIKMCALGVINQKQCKPKSM